MIEQQQNGEDYLFVANDRSFAGKYSESVRMNGTSGKVTLTSGFASPTTLLQIEWDKPAVDGAVGTATTEHVIYRATGPVVVKSVEFVPDAALVASDTNYASIILTRRNADGTNAQVVAQINTTLTVAPFSGNWVQWVAVKLSLTAANVAMVAGQILTIQITKTGTGVVVQPGQLLVDYALA